MDEMGPADVKTSKKNYTRISFIPDFAKYET